MKFGLKLYFLFRSHNYNVAYPSATPSLIVGTFNRYEAEYDTIYRLRIIQNYALHFSKHY